MRCVDNCDGKLLELDGVYVSQNEIDAITSAVTSEISRRLAFTILCLAKYKNLKYGVDTNWVNNDEVEIFKLACVNDGTIAKEKRLHELYVSGLIRFSNKVDSLSILCLFADPSSGKDNYSILVDDFRNVGNFYRRHTGDKRVKRCKDCGKLIRITSKTQQFCPECSERRKLSRHKKYNQKRE